MAKQDLYTASRKVTAGAVIDNEPSAEEKLKGVEKWYQNNNKLVNNILIGVPMAIFDAYRSNYRTSVE